MNRRQLFRQLPSYIPYLFVRLQKIIIKHFDFIFQQTAVAVEQNPFIFTEMHFI